MYEGDVKDPERFETATAIGDVFDVIVTQAETVPEEGTLRDAVDAVLRSSTTRKAYVVDGDGKLKGVIGIETLMRLVAYRAGERPAGVISFFRFVRDMQSEGVRGFMDRSKPVTRETKIVDLVRMVVDEHLNDFPVVDPDGRLTGEVNTQHLLQVTRSLFDPRT
ncbi:MAG TPA: CBS domain-containing protein [Thermoplasmata archaeon]|nr:CBS domain-containing protein [Thermoplasmata archaeon]